MKREGNKRRGVQLANEFRADVDGGAVSEQITRVSNFIKKLVKICKSLIINALNPIVSNPRLYSGRVCFPMSIADPQREVNWAGRWLRRLAGP